jgi:hypothetical protein
VYVQLYRPLPEGPARAGAKRGSTCGKG